MIESFWSSLVLLCRSQLAQCCLVQFILLVQENSISSSIDLYLCACFCLFRVQIIFDHPNFQNSKQYQSQCSPLQNSPLLYLTVSNRQLLSGYGFPTIFKILTKIRVWYLLLLLYPLSPLTLQSKANHVKSI